MLTTKMAYGTPNLTGKLLVPIPVDTNRLPTMLDN
jgi:hypothetical protein